MELIPPDMEYLFPFLHADRNISEVFAVCSANNHRSNNRFDERKETHDEISLQADVLAIKAALGKS